MLKDKLKELQNEPQSMDELFSSSKEGQIFEKVRGSMQILGQQMMQGLQEQMSQLVSDAVSQIKVKDGKDGRDGQKGLDGTVPTKEEVLSIINPLLPKKDEVSVDSVKGLRGIIDSLSNRISTRRSGGGGGSTVVTDDLTAQCDGATKTFTTTKKIGAVINVASTQFPVVYRPVIDYSGSGTTLILTSEVGAPATSQTLIITYVEG